MTGREALATIGNVRSLCSALAAAVVVVACGAKSGLLEGRPEAGVVEDAGPDVIEDASVDIVPDVGPDAEPDAAPTICDDSGPPAVYVITAQSLLYRFDPPSATFIHIGTAFCQNSSVPFSMGVDRGGTAYVLYRDGHLYKVDTKSAKCQPTAFSPFQLDWALFGMGFVFDPAGNADNLYVTESTYTSPSKGLAKLDVETLKLSFIAPYASPFSNAIELTGTGDGRLFGFGLPAGPQGSRLAEIDPATGKLLSSVELALGNENSSFAFAYWGGDFYMFTAPEATAPSDAHRYRPSDGSLTWVAKVNATVVGAGVSTCAPL